jgi:hypothetical protein
LTAFRDQCLEIAWWSDRVWWNDCCWRTRSIIFARMQIHFSRRFSFFSLVTENDNEPRRLSLSFLFCFFAVREHDDELVPVVVFFCFGPSHSEKTKTSWHSTSSFFVLFTCTQRTRQRTDVSVYHRLVLFCFCAPKEDGDKWTLIVILFCFCALEKDVYLI